MGSLSWGLQKVKSAEPWEIMTAVELRTFPRLAAVEWLSWRKVKCECVCAVAGDNTGQAACSGWLSWRKVSV